MMYNLSAKKRQPKRNFFYTFNALVYQNHQVIVSADKSPADLEGMEGLRSRLGWGLVADIHTTTYELRLGILQAKSEKVPIPVPKKVLEFLAHKITSNVRELQGALIRIVAQSTLVGREMNLEMVQDVLRDLLRSNERVVKEIIRKVAEYYRVRLADMHSAKRSRCVASGKLPCSYPRSSQHDPCQKLGENLAGVITRLFCTESKKFRTS